MAKIIAMHSFRRGVGKTTICANLAVLLAVAGYRVGVMDGDLQTPGLHYLFGLEDDLHRRTLTDYLQGRCPIQQASHEVPLNAEADPNGRLFVIPASGYTGDMARIFREGFDVGALHDGVRHLVDVLELDFVLLDTHPGVDEVTLLSLAFSDRVLIVLRPDAQDFQGTTVSLAMIERLDIASSLLINQVPDRFDPAHIQQDAARAYGCPVAAVLRFSEDLLHTEQHAFALTRPEHPFVQELRAASRHLIDPPNT